MATALRRSLGHIVALTPQAQESEDTVAPPLPSVQLLLKKSKRAKGHGHHGPKPEPRAPRCSWGENSQMLQNTGPVCSADDFC